MTEELDAEQIQAHCTYTAQAACGVHLFATLPSTNAWLLQRCGDFSTPQLCVTELQTAGRGRRGKSWQSPARGVTFSVLRRFRLPGAQLSGLSLVTGCAVVTVLESMGLHGLKMKWPNDILHTGGKLCGLLIELRAADGGHSDTITGVGLNYHGVGNADAIDQPYTELSTLMINKLPERNRLIGRLATAILDAYALYEQSGFAPFRAQWERYDAYSGKQVVLRRADGEGIDGICRGVADNGALKMQTRDGMREFSSGEISVRLSE